MKEMELQKDVRAAILTAPDDYSYAFFELNAENEGYNLRIFRLKAEAIAWLSE